MGSNIPSDELPEVVPAETQLSQVLSRLVLEKKSVLVFLPFDRSTDGKGIYSQSVLFMAKEFRASGIDAQYLDASDDRIFEVKKAAVESNLSVAFAILKDFPFTAVWELLKNFIRRDHPSAQTLDVAFSIISENGASKTWTSSGPVEGTLIAIDRFLEDPN